MESPAGPGRAVSWQPAPPARPSELWSSPRRSVCLLPGPAGVYGRLTHRQRQRSSGHWAAEGREDGREEGGSGVTVGALGRQKEINPSAATARGSLTLCPGGLTTTESKQHPVPPRPFETILPPAPLAAQSHRCRVASWGPALPPLVFCPVPQVRSPRHSDSRNTGGRCRLSCSRCRGSGPGTGVKPTAPRVPNAALTRVAQQNRLDDFSRIRGGLGSALRVPVRKAWGSLDIRPRVTLWAAGVAGHCPHRRCALCTPPPSGCPWVASFLPLHQAGPCSAGHTAARRVSPGS